METLYYIKRHDVEQSDEALPNKPEVRGFDSVTGIFQ